MATRQLGINEAESGDPPPINRLHTPSVDNPPNLLQKICTDMLSSPLACTILRMPKNCYRYQVFAFPEYGASADPS